MALVVALDGVPLIVAAVVVVDVLAVGLSDILGASCSQMGLPAFCLCPSDYLARRYELQGLLSHPIPTTDLSPQRRLPPIDRRHYHRLCPCHPPLLPLAWKGLAAKDLPVLSVATFWVWECVSEALFSSLLWLPLFGVSPV